jgi:hypothetical protein
MILSSWATGLFFIFIVTIIWTGASYLTEYIYSDLEFKSPFLLTYFSSSFFVLYLPLWQLWVLLGWVNDPPSRRESTNDNLLKASDIVYNILDQNSHDGDSQSTNINHDHGRVTFNKAYIKSGNKIVWSLMFIKEALSLVKIPGILSKVYTLPTTAESPEIDPKPQLSSRCVY